MNHLSTRPDLEEVIKSIQTNTVCTGTQCFENEESAFGLIPIPTHHNTPSPLLFVVFVILLTFALSRTSRNTLSDKPSATHAIRHLRTDD